MRNKQALEIRFGIQYKISSYYYLYAEKTLQSNYQNSNITSSLFDCMLFLSHVDLTAYTNYKQNRKNRLTAINTFMDTD